MSLAGVGHVRSSVWWFGDSGGRRIWVIVLVSLSDCHYTSIFAGSSMLVNCFGVCDAAAHGLDLLLSHCDGDGLVWWGIMLGVVCDSDSLHWPVDVGYGDVLRCGGCVYALWLRLIMRGNEGSETGSEGECKRMHILSGLLWNFLLLEMNEEVEVVFFSFFFVLSGGRGK